MKYFVISDIHIFYTEMMTSLISNGFDIKNPDYKVIICGDAFDRVVEYHSENWKAVKGESRFQEFWRGL